MSTTISAGSQASVALPAGDTLSVFGVGTYQVSAPMRPDIAAEQHPIGPSGTAIGPFDVAASVRLVAAGALAYDTLDAADILDRSGRLAIPAAAAGGILSLVSGAGKAGLYGNVRQAVPMTLAAWDDRAGTGATFEVDPTVTFDGQPSIKIVIPAGQTTARIGTLLDTAVFPRNWDLSGLVLAYRSSKVAASNGANVFVGDAAGFASNYLIWGQAPPSYAQSTRDNEWWVAHIDKTTAGGIGWTQNGTYVNQVARRVRVSVGLSAAQAEPVTFWIGAFGFKQPRQKPTMILTYDDARASIYSHVWPLMRAHRVPMSLAVISSLIGQAGYLTEAQLLEMYRDPTALFECVTHSSQHINVNTRGDAGYVADVVAVRDWLTARGITGPGINHHAWVESVWSNGAIDGLQAAGFLSARAAGQAFPHRAYSDHCIRGGDKARWLLNTLTTLGNTKGATGMIAEVDAWLAAVAGIGGFVMLNGHDFAATSSDAYTMAFKEHAPLIEYIASLRDAGDLDLMTWSQWYSTYCA